MRFPILRRRHLDASQRAMIAGQIANLQHGQKKADVADTAIAVSQAEAAALLKVSVDAVQRAQAVAAEGTPELKVAVVNGTISVSAARELLMLPAEQQQTLAKQPTVAKKVAAARRTAHRRRGVTAVEPVAPTPVWSAPPSTTTYYSIENRLARVLEDVPESEWTTAVWDTACLLARQSQKAKAEAAASREAIVLREVQAAGRAGVTRRTLATRLAWHHGALEAPLNALVLREKVIQVSGDAGQRNAKYAFAGEVTR